MQAEKLQISLPADRVQRVRRVTFPILLPAILLLACTSFSTFDEALPLLKGENISMSIDYLGIPDNKYQIDDREIYVWSTAHNYTFVDAVSSNTNGNVGGTPFSAYSMTYAPRTTILSCESKMSTRHQIVEQIKYSGNNGACFTYSERLKPLLQSK